MRPELLELEEKLQKHKQHIWNYYKNIDDILEELEYLIESPIHDEMLKRWYQKNKHFFNHIDSIIERKRCVS